MDVVDQNAIVYSPARQKSSGANWFFWIAALSVINSLIVFFNGSISFVIGLGATQWIDGRAQQISRADGNNNPIFLALFFDLLIAAMFVSFGYLAKRGSDVAFLVGIFLYTVDAMFVIGARDFFGFGFHMIALFFLFKGLIASRKMRENGDVA